MREECFITAEGALEKLMGNMIIDDVNLNGLYIYCKEIFEYTLFIITVYDNPLTFTHGAVTTMLSYSFWMDCPLNLSNCIAYTSAKVFVTLTNK